MKITEVPMNSTLHCTMKSIAPLGVYRNPTTGKSSIRVFNIGRTNRIKAGQFTQFLGTVVSNDTTNKVITMNVVPMRNSSSFMVDRSIPTSLVSIHYSNFKRVRLISEALVGNENQPVKRKDIKYLTLSLAPNIYRTATPIKLV